MDPCDILDEVRFSPPGRRGKCVVMCVKYCPAGLNMDVNLENEMLESEEVRFRTHHKLGKKQGCP